MTDKINWLTEAEVRMMPVADHEAEIARLTAEMAGWLAGAVKVKPLVWGETHDDRGDGSSEHNGGYEADSEFGFYEICMGFDSDGYYWSTQDEVGNEIGSFDDPDLAKAAAQADYEARVCAALQPDPDARQADLSDAARDVLTERARQISAEGWTQEHDDAHKAGELASAAGAYALYAASDSHHREALDIRNNPQRSRPYGWPWSKEWWKPTDPRRDLVKAGALILAEIERRDRALTPPADLAAKIGGAE